MALFRLARPLANLLLCNNEDPTKEPVGSTTTDTTCVLYVLERSDGIIFGSKVLCDTTGDKPVYVFQRVREHLGFPGDDNFIGVSDSQWKASMTLNVTEDNVLEDALVFNPEDKSICFVSEIEITNVPDEGDWYVEDAMIPLFEEWEAACSHNT